LLGLFYILFFKYLKSQPKTNLMSLSGLLKPLSGLVLSLISISVFSQDRVCGFDHIHKRLVQNQDYRKSILENEQKVQQYLRRSSKTAATVYTIPVVVHVIHKGEAVGVGTNISDAQIQSAITAMTQHYRGILGTSVDAEIEFELANLDPNCNPTSGIERINGTSVAGYSANGLVTGGSGNEVAVKSLSRWSNNNYYNIWVVSEINNNGGGAGIQGFAYFPGAPAEIDGAVMLYNAFGYDPTLTLGYNLKSYTNLNTTATHELGHAFGLFHTFEGDDTNGDDVVDACPANGDCSLDGDMVCDTDPHQRTPSTCPSPATANPCNGGLPLGTIINNYMDYSSEACQDRFTTGQVERMRAYLEILRPGLITSLAKEDPYPYGTYADPAPACIPATGATGLSGAYAGIMNDAINNINFTSYDASTHGGYVDGT
jgi:hypothetical protein